MSQTLCQADPELWDGRTAADVEEASDRCMDCPFAVRCRAIAPTVNGWGVWGGQYFENGAPATKTARKRKE